MTLRPDLLLEKVRLQETIIACLVKQCGGEARLPLADIEDPPEIEEDDDPYNGDWVYRIKGEPND